MHQRGERLAVRGTEIEEPWVRSHAEWFFPQPVEVQNQYPSFYAAWFGTETTTGMLRISITSADVRNVGSKYSAKNVVATLTKAAKKKPTKTTKSGLVAGRTGTNGGTASATLSMLRLSSVSEARAPSRLDRYSK